MFQVNRLNKLAQVGGRAAHQDQSQWSAGVPARRLSIFCSRTAALQAAFAFQLSEISSAFGAHYRSASEPSTSGIEPPSWFFSYVSICLLRLS